MSQINFHRMWDRWCDNIKKKSSNWLSLREWLCYPLSQKHTKVKFATFLLVKMNEEERVINRRFIIHLQFKFLHKNFSFVNLQTRCTMGIEKKFLLILPAFHPQFWLLFSSLSWLLIDSFYLNDDFLLLLVCSSALGKHLTRDRNQLRLNFCHEKPLKNSEGDVNSRW